MKKLIKFILTITFFYFIGYITIIIFSITHRMDKGMFIVNIFISIVSTILIWVDDNPNYFNKK